MSAIPPGMNSEASPESAAWDWRVRCKKGDNKCERAFKILLKWVPVKYRLCHVSRITSVGLWGGAIRTTQ